MRIHHLNCGSFRPLGGRLVAGTGSPFAPGRMVCHCLLLETDSGLVLVDTGIGLSDVARPQRLGRTFLTITRPLLEESETAARQVVQLGYQVEDVRHIVLTHLDLDHASGLGDFPHAKVHVYEQEFQAALHPLTSQERQRYRSVQWAHNPDWVRHATAGDSWRGFSAVRELPGLPPTILLVPLAGHTRGHAGVAIEGDDGWLLHAGDAYFAHGQMAADPSCPPFLHVFQILMQTDRTTRLYNVQRLRELAMGGEVDVFSAHDESELTSHASLAKV
jgi:glyoxylase-like metal-dependent hydrolase (beta-lactamase superfamily II)